MPSLQTVVVREDVHWLEADPIVPLIQSGDNGIALLLPRAPVLLRLLQLAAEERHRVGGTFGPSLGAISNQIALRFPR